ncbi:hypothetical protein CDAR_369351 [Caerostris darwini]|uniref:Maturase K n=1 Tax=Caerostris darwini TaxID=1538125 RepID=A0AAV4RZ31_9ARAC|nr:hypothetical protein CDAR_369351 [Caerostris darwini]
MYSKVRLEYSIYISDSHSSPKTRKSTLESSGFYPHLIGKRRKRREIKIIERYSLPYFIPHFSFLGDLLFARKIETSTLLIGSSSKKKRGTGNGTELILMEHVLIFEFFTQGNP